MAATSGNFQMVPIPIADPAAAGIFPTLDDHWGPCSAVWPLANI
ncbi:hypothetical protein NT01EI_3727 [Edwardsiella ictaluri 93-146]|uniref:Uncharacterized protein n=1 Tax=Edwardsiella ictaluri (strain 93-146) TaxID=634503 RepID=C5BB12_EDWI9|nr:hypothetical protein NT01EI_3727 [Edwardsiella ictaluri 93-146]